MYTFLKCRTHKAKVKQGSAQNRNGEASFYCKDTQRQTRRHKDKPEGTKTNQKAQRQTRRHKDKPEGTKTNQKAQRQTRRHKDKPEGTKKAQRQTKRHKDKGTKTNQKAQRQTKRHKDKDTTFFTIVKSVIGSDQNIDELGMIIGEDLTLGSDDEKAISKALDFVFPNASRYLFTKYLRENIIKYLTDKVGVSKTDCSTFFLAQMV